jgi:Fic family protein
MELNDTLKQIDSLKQEAEKLQPVKPELERVFWEKFSMEFNYNSNHIEGNTLTYGQTKLLLLFDRITGDNKGRDVEEMKAHNVALKMITELSFDPESRLSEKLIREINELILVRPFYNDAITQDGQPTKRLITPGKYKSHPNSVLLPDGNMFYYASPEETPALMGDLVEWYNNEKDKIHPIELAARFHYKLVRIHPFDDSNGRTTRLMMNYILMQNGYAPIVIESKKKEAYLTALNKADVGDINAFVDYIAALAIKWQEIYLKAMKGEKIEEPDDLDKEIQLIKNDFKSANDKIEITFSKVILKELFAISIFPLINKISLELSKFDDLFLKRSTLFKAIGQGTCISVDGLPVFWGQILENPISAPFYFEYYHSHLQLKKESGLNFDFNCLIVFEFSEHYYLVKYSGEDYLTIKKYYHQQLSNDEINDFSKQVLRQELKAVKN